MSDTVHFEELWEKCEKMSGPSTVEEIIGKLSASVDELRDVCRASVHSNDKRLVQGMKDKAAGRLLMTLTSLSAKENIDVYQALKEQFDVAKVKDVAVKF